MVVRWSVQVPDTGTLGYGLAALSQMKERTASRPVESKSVTRETHHWIPMLDLYVRRTRDYD
jgi:hypothetical protein